VIVDEMAVIATYVLVITAISGRLFVLLENVDYVHAGARTHQILLPFYGKVIIWFSDLAQTLP
jgi:hypothetical protein